MTRLKQGLFAEPVRGVLWVVVLVVVVGIVVGAVVRAAT